jgi:hypothetical protein
MANRASSPPATPSGSLYSTRRDLWGVGGVGKWETPGVMRRACFLSACASPWLKARTWHNRRRRSPCSTRRNEATSQNTCDVSVGRFSVLLPGRYSTCHYFSDKARRPSICTDKFDTAPDSPASWLSNAVYQSY